MSTFGLWRPNQPLQQTIVRLAVSAAEWQSRWSGEMKNTFSPDKYYDHRIRDENGNWIGRIRIRPRGVLLALKHAQDWIGLSLSKLAALTKEHGRAEKK